MSLEDWLQNKATQPQTLNPLEEVVKTLEKEHTGSGMRAHINLLGSEKLATKCYCNLKKYGKDVFDSALMPDWWVGCGSCKNSV